MYCFVFIYSLVTQASRTTTTRRLSHQWKSSFPLISAITDQYLRSFHRRKQTKRKGKREREAAWEFVCLPSVVMAAILKVHFPAGCVAYFPVQKDLEILPVNPLHQGRLCPRNWWSSRPRGQLLTWLKKSQSNLIWANPHSFLSIFQRAPTTRPLVGPTTVLLLRLLISSTRCLSFLSQQLEH